MLTKPKDRKWICRLLIFMALIVAAAGGRPFLAMASEQNYEQYYEHYYETHRFDRVFVVFNPDPGAFPPEETADGVRLPFRGETLTDFPPNPTRAGYTFDGWRLPGGEALTADYLVVNNEITLHAIWIPYGTAPQNSPAPGTSPSPSPEPGASPSPSPAPGTSPSPSPTPGGASPTPYKGQDGYRPNPGTNPLAISFLIFIAVIGLGIAAYNIIKLAAKYAEEKGQYIADATRYEREARLTDLLEEDNDTI
ncbi:MAG: hypothetical protein FWC73_03700 [Defluviitaleaceae bacterium]|nr:hypothetical protein [Defluviitaleaceae bacterium]